MSKLYNPENRATSGGVLLRTIPTQTKRPRHNHTDTHNDKGRPFTAPADKGDKWVPQGRQLTTDHQPQPINVKQTGGAIGGRGEGGGGHSGPHFNLAENGPGTQQGIIVNEN